MSFGTGFSDDNYVYHGEIPWTVGNGHPSVCMCHECAPDESAYYTCGCGDTVATGEPHECEATREAAAYFASHPATTAQAREVSVEDYLSELKDHPF